MSLPPLANWDSTKLALHQAAQVVGGIKKVAAKPLPNYAHLGLYVMQTGVTTGKLPAGDELILDFTKQVVTYICPDQSVNPIALAGHTQTSLADAVVKEMNHHGHGVEPDWGKITGADTFAINAAVASEYATALYSVFSAMARFRARLLGELSPMIIWPHGFDLSFLWFTHGFDESKDPHLNFGFSPGSAGFPRPYVYMYASPMPNGLLDVNLPAPARWYQEAWKGAVIDYDALASMPDHEAVLQGILSDIFAAVSPLLS